MSLPENRIGEIVSGQLHVSPRPAGPHAVAHSVLGALLVSRFQLQAPKPGGWWIIDEPELHWGEDVVVPDVAGWRRERMPEPPGGAFVELPPDWLVEVLSPSTARLDRAEKLPLYARVGIRWVWLIDPLAKTLEVLRLEREHWTVVSVHSGRDTVTAEPFQELPLQLAQLWGES